jgi:zinc/manganese transport system permease protein
VTLLQAGFFSSVPVQNALLIGAGAALLSGAAGVFTVLRGQSFAGHALADISSAGGAMAYLLGISPLLGFFSLSVLGALALEAIGTRRAAARDLAAGIVLGAGLGVTALLLYLDVTVKGTAGAAVAVMFGSLFAAPPGLGIAVALGALAGLAGLGVIYRPLLLASLDVELARANGVNTRLLGGAYLLLLALAVTLSAMAVGAILSTALLIGPAAAALRLARNPVAAMALSALLGLLCAWGGVWLAYQSYGWTPGHVWPVSFFITALVLVVYAAASLARRR